MPQYIHAVSNISKLDAKNEIYKNPLQKTFNRVIKRTFDLTVSFVICILAIPFLPVIALLIKMQSTGPILFCQKRTGINGNTFLCYKFRSMHLNNETETRQATNNDPRIFSFGKFMRSTHIDEIPNFINVLKGDMSVIGPRPHMLYHTQKYNPLIDHYMDRHRCKPSITSYAQVLGFCGATPELWQMEERVKHNIWYIYNLVCPIGPVDTLSNCCNNIQKIENT